MSDLRPMWEKICGDLGINPGLVHVYFVYAHEARNDFWLLSGWGGVTWNPDDGAAPEVLAVFPFIAGKNGWQLDTLELRDTCYHELIHLLLRDEIEEEDVEKIGDIINRRQDGWRYWRSYLRGRAIALGLGPPEPAPLSLWQYARFQRKKRGISGRMIRMEAKDGVSQCEVTT